MLIFRFLLHIILFFTVIIQLFNFNFQLKYFIFQFVHRINCLFTIFLLLKFLFFLIHFILNNKLQIFILPFI